MDTFYIQSHLWLVGRKERRRKNREKLIACLTVAGLLGWSLGAIAHKNHIPDARKMEATQCPLYAMDELAEAELKIEKLKEYNASLVSTKTKLVSELSSLKEATNNIPAIYKYTKNPYSLIGRIKLKTKWAKYIQQAAAETGLEPHFIEALIIHESGAKVDAKSHCGAVGLTQLMPGTAKRFGCFNRYDPQSNILAGSKYLAWLMQRYNGNKKLALAAYNSGEGAVDKYKGIPPYKETQKYVPSVLAHYNSYKKEGIV